MTILSYKKLILFILYFYLRNSIKGQSGINLAYFLIFSFLISGYD